MNDLHLSPAGANLVKAFESCLRPIGAGRLRTYVCPAGVLTIGWGHTNDHGRKFGSADVWTQKECDDEFLRDMQLFERAVKRNVTVPLKQWQFDALVSFTFNCGEGALRKSTLLRRVNAGDFRGAAEAFKMYNRGGGRVLAGLVRRRASESLLFRGIPDNDYDGRPDKVRAPTPQEASRRPPMPQRVDVPAEDKSNPLPKSKTIWGAVLMAITSIGSTVASMFEYVTTPLGFAAFCIILILLGIGTYMVVKGRIDVQKIVKQLIQEKEEA